MKFCSHCGKEVMDEAVICVNCGCSIQPNAKVVANYENDVVNAGLVILSILIPIAGVILWPVKHKTAPKAARTYGIVGICAWVVYYLIMMSMM